MSAWTSTSVATEYMIVGIDPGLSGGIAIMSGCVDLVDIQPMPTTTREVQRKVRRKVDMRALRDAFEGLRDCNREKTIRVFIERQMPMGAEKRGSIGAFMSGESYGHLTGMLWGLHVAYRPVLASAWKRALELPSSSDYAERKRIAVLAAQRLFPRVNLMRTAKCSKPHDGMAEALLIAEYGRRFLSRGEQ